MKQECSAQMLTISLSRLVRQYEEQLELMAPECNHPKHKGIFVSHVCLKVGCKETRGHCIKCNLKQHRDCGAHIKLYDELIMEIQTLEGKNNTILKIFSSVLDKIKKLQKEVQSRCEIIKRFIVEQSSDNLNKFAEIFPSYSEYDLKKLFEGKEQLENIFQGYFAQNLVHNHGDSHNINENNKQQKQDEKIEPKKQIRLINISQNENNENQKDSVNQFESEGQINIEQQQKEKEMPQRIIQIEPKNNENIIEPLPKKFDAPQTGSDDAQQCHMRGQFHYNNHQYEQALEYFDLAIVLDPNNPSTWNNKGTALNKLNMNFESIECFDRALEIINSRPQIDKEAKMVYIRNKASTLARLGQLYESVKLIDEGLALDPTNQNLFEVKLTTLLLSDQSSEALKIVDEAIQQDQSNYNHKLFQLKGVILIKMDKIDEGIECLLISNSIKLNKETYFAMGKALVKLCRLSEAELCLKSAIELDKNYQEAIQELEMVQKYQKFQ